MAESVELPSRLAILPFRNKVLLPGAIIRIRCTSPSSVKLVEQELWQREEKGLIGILPVRDAAAVDVASPSTGLGERSKIQEETTEIHKHGGKNQQEVVHWHNRGVAARALHLSRGVEKPSGRVTYIVVLEGLCRFNVQELSTRGTYYTAHITPLDMMKSDDRDYGEPYDPDYSEIPPNAYEYVNNPLTLELFRNGPIPINKIPQRLPMFNGTGCPNEHRHKYEHTLMPFLHSEDNLAVLMPQTFTNVYLT